MKIKTLIALSLFSFARPAIAAVFLNGTNNSVNLGNPSKLQTLNTMTVCAWITPSSITRSDWVAQWDSGIVKHFGLFSGVSVYSFSFYAYNGTTSNGANSATFTLGNTYFVCGYYDGTNIGVYMNGVAGTPVALTGPLYSSSSDNVYIGYDSSPHYGNGTIDNVQIWNRALSASEISALYQSRSRVVISSGLVGWWKLDEYNPNTSVAAGMQFLDYSGTNFTGTWVGSNSTMQPSILRYQ